MNEIEKTYAIVRHEFLNIIDTIEQYADSDVVYQKTYLQFEKIIKSIMIESIKEDHRDLLKAIEENELEEQLNAVLYELNIFKKHIQNILDQIKDGQDVSEYLYMLNEQAKPIKGKVENRLHDLSDFVDIKQTFNIILSPLKIVADSVLNKTNARKVEKK